LRLATRIAQVALEIQSPLLLSMLGYNIILAPGWRSEVKAVLG
jgi:hypothetical protein